MLLTRPLVALCLVLVIACSAQAADKFTNHSFKKTQISDQFFSEGANFADFNRDGVGDVVSGPFWYPGPTFTDRVAYYDGKPFDIEGYSDNFFAFTHDFNQDEWPDILIVGFPNKEAFWYENPQGKTGPWPRHTAIPVVDNESPQFTDVTGDGQPELVCMSRGFLGYAEIPKDDPKQPWKFIGVSPNNNYHMFTHGLG
ncbi:MAG: VCBS repeat-containing protein, partial [Pirellulales bacterium]|nr:VCBS repeat-containing protein [Pirellulales bacterium]